MTASSASSISILCVHCGGREADPQTGRCLKCGKVAISPDLAREFGHPTLDRGIGQERRSPSAAYRPNGSIQTAAELPPTPAAAEPAAAPTPISPDVQVAEAEVELAQYFERQPALTFVLPDSRETTSWLTKTKAVRDQLLARADKAEAQIAELQTEAERCRQTAAAFMSLLGQLSVAGETETPPPVQNPGSQPAERLKPAGKWSKNHDACIDCQRSDVPHCANGRCQACDRKWRYERTRS